LVDSEGNQLGVMKRELALDRASLEELDLVEVAPQAKPPVCRIMDYGKFKYLQNKRAVEAKKRQHTVDVKEIKMRPKIAEHDYQFKKRHVQRFLEDGNRVKVTMIFRGRERAHEDLGREILQRLASDVAEVSSMDGDPKKQGGTIVMNLMPNST